MTFVLAITGHRPEQFTDRQGHDSRVALKCIFWKYRPSAVIVGMARGVDLWAGDAALDLDIPVVAALPFATHRSSKYGPQSEKEVRTYDRIISNAEEVYPVTEFEDGAEVQWYEYARAMDQRNRWMVDQGDKVLAIWNGTQKGGTFNCCKYAVGKKPTLQWNPVNCETRVLEKKDLK